MRKDMFCCIWGSLSFLGCCHIEFLRGIVSQSWCSKQYWPANNSLSHQISQNFSFPGCTWERYCKL